VLTRRTAVAAAGTALATVPAAVAAARDDGAAQTPRADGGRPPASALAHRSIANVLRDGGRQQRGERAHRTLVSRNVRLAHKLARARDHELPDGRTERVRAYTRPRLRAENRELSAKLHRIAPASSSTGSAGGGGASPRLQAIAACESGGDPRSIGGGGAFRGKYQFTYGTWASVGGSGDPAAASEAEQDKRAQMLLHQSGSSPWPVCGR
jgi:transglycosylase-like protein